jgi:hypothetical protein
MSEIDHVFARLGGGQSGPTEQRELRSIPRKGGATGSRVVEVVRLSPQGTTAGQDQAHRPVSKVRAATWDDGFPPKSAWGPSPSPAPVATVTLKPVAHVMPMWEPVEKGGTSTSPPSPRWRFREARAPSQRRPCPQENQEFGAGASPIHSTPPTRARIACAAAIWSSQRASGAGS